MASRYRPSPSFQMAEPLLVLRICAVALNEAPNRAAVSDALATLLPMLDVMDQHATSGSRLYLDHETAIGTGDRRRLHFAPLAKPLRREH